VQVVDPHTENYIDSYTYLRAPRMWFEQIGFWGPPGTPPPDEEKPIPIKPNAVLSLPSPEAYKAAYPDYIGEPYVWRPPLLSSVNAMLSKGEGLDSADQEVFASMMAIFALGATIGSSVVALCIKNSRKSYLPIR
jgi:hypothetical protein